MKDKNTEALDRLRFEFRRAAADVRRIGRRLRAVADELPDTEPLELDGEALPDTEATWARDCARSLGDYGALEYAAQELEKEAERDWRAEVLTFWQRDKAERLLRELG